MYKLKRILTNYKIDYLLIALIGLYIFPVWFGLNKVNDLCFGGDIIYPLNPSWNINYMKYTWSDNNGGVAEIKSAYYFHLFFFYIFSKLGLSLFSIQKLYLYLCFILPGLSIYYLTAIFLNPISSLNRIACWISGLFYMVNPVILQFPQFYFFYGVSPLILALFIRCLEVEDLRLKVKYSLIASFFLFGFLISLPSHNIFFVLLCILPIYLLLQAVFVKKNAISAVKSFFIFYGIVFLVNLWCLVPFIFFVINDSPQQLLTKVTLKFGDLIPSGAALLKVMSLNSIFEFIGNGYYFSIGKYFIWFINIFFAIFAFSALLAKPKIKSKYIAVIFFSLVSLIGIIITLGPNPPWGKIYQWILNRVLLLRGFRTVGSIITLVALGYSVLIAISFSELFPKLEKYFLKTLEIKFTKLLMIFFSCLIFVLILINGWPLAMGTHFKQPGYWPNNSAHKIPKSYYKLNDWFKQNDESQDYRILSTPPLTSYQEMRWPSGYFSGSSVIPYIISKPVIFTMFDTTGVVTSNIEYLYKELAYQEEPFVIANLAGLLNIKYVIFDGYNINPPIKIKILSGIKNNIVGIQRVSSEIKYIGSFDKLDLFKIDDKYFFPRIYVASDIKLLEGKLEHLAKFFKKRNQLTKSSIIFLTDNLNLEEQVFLKNLETKKLKSPLVTLKQINSTKYKVQVINSEGPFFLVLNNSFNSNWQAFINGIKIKRHMKVNGYANAWYLDKAGSFTILLNYQIQNLFYIGISISSMVFVFCLIFIVRGISNLKK